MVPDLSRLLVYRFVSLVSEGEVTRHDAAVVKRRTDEDYKSVVDLGLQVLGGYGHCMEYFMQRFFRDFTASHAGRGLFGDPAQRHRPQSRALSAQGGAKRDHQNSQNSREDSDHAV